MLVTIRNLEPIQRRAPDPFGQMVLNAYGSGKLPWTFLPTEDMRRLEKEIEAGAIDVEFEPDRLEKYFRGYFSKLVGTAGLLRPSSRTYRADYATIQAAIDAVASEAAAGNRFLIDLPPDDFNENVVGVPYVSLRGGGLGQTTRISSGSGHTLTIPDRNCGVYGIRLRSASGGATDSALRIVPDSTPPEQAFVRDFYLEATAGARCLWYDGASNQVVLALGGMDPWLGQEAVYIDGGGVGGSIVWLQGGGGAPIGQPGPMDFMKLRNGAGFIGMGIVNMSAAAAGAGAAIDADGSFLWLQEVGLDGENILRTRNGCTLFGRNVWSMGGPSGGRGIDDDGTLLIAGENFAFDGIGNPAGHAGLGWNPPGAIIAPCDTELSYGTKGLGGADRRLTAVGATPAVGARFYATDAQYGNPAVPGPGCMLEWWPGQGWVDGSGTVHP